MRLQAQQGRPAGRNPPPPQSRCPRRPNSFARCCPPPDRNQSHCRNRTATRPRPRASMPRTRFFSSLVSPVVDELRQPAPSNRFFIRGRPALTQQVVCRITSPHCRAAGKAHGLAARPSLHWLHDAASPLANNPRTASSAQHCASPVRTPLPAGFAGPGNADRYVPHTDMRTKCWTDFFAQPRLQLSQPAPGCTGHPRWC